MKIRKHLKFIILLASCLLSLILFGVLLVWSNMQTGGLVDQQFADRWSDEGGFAQNSVYFTLGSGLSEDSIIPLRRSIDSALVGESVEAKYDDRGWVDAYSAEKSVTCTRGAATCQALATGVGGDFFLFHPMRLIAGAYISESDLMHDLVVLDDLAAWFLFGSTDCIGLDVQIGGSTYIVAGVVARDDNNAMKLAYGDTARIYMSYEMLGSDEISCYETLIPNPIPSFAHDLVIKALGKDESKYTAVENSDRYKISRIYELIKQAPTNAMRTIPIAYPFWENAARVVESHMTRAYVGMLILLLYPTVVLIVFIIRLWRRRKWRAGALIRTAGDKIYETRVRLHAAAKLKQKGTVNTAKPADEPVDNEPTIDIEKAVTEIIREMETEELGQ